MLRSGESLQTVVQRNCTGGVVFATQGRQVQGDVPERIYGGRNVTTTLTDDVRLELASENRVDDAIASRTWPLLRAVYQMPMEKVKRSDEKLVGVLLLVTGQMVSVLPGHVEQQVGNQRTFIARVKLLKQPENKTKI